MQYKNIPEEELKIRIGQDYFSDFDHATKLKKVDFCVLPKKIRNQTELFKPQSLLWAEAKSNKRDIISMFAQLILTIGKARTFNQHLPPAFLGVFDAEKIAFVPYQKVSELFYKNDFNWNVAPSNHTTKEFAEIKELIDGILEREKYLYYFGKDDKNLKFFIKQNLAKGTENNKIKITKNNFTWVFEDWLTEVKPLITPDFEKDKKQRILAYNFFLADLFVDDKDTTTTDDDESINENLFVVWRKGLYEIDPEKVNRFNNELDVPTRMTFWIKDENKNIYENFWKRYKRPPLPEFQDYILERKDLLVPQDFRERKGAYFTPRQWVNLSQKYIADVLGENWQDEYYVWDCCAGSGNLLRGLTNKYNIYASTLDQGDVEDVKGKAKENKINLLEKHVFQFDFLNDDFFDKYRIPKSKKYIDKVITDNGEYDISEDKTKVTIDNKTYEIELIEKSKLPLSLQEIIKDEEKRKKLVVYINPPYAEASTTKTITKTGENKAKTAINNKIYEKYKTLIGNASNELFAQFLIRVYCEIPQCVLANFSKLKNLQAPNFSDFREKFRAKLEKIFLVPANTFDNVKGSFPIGFFVWNGAKEEEFTKITADVYNEKKSLDNKSIYSYGNTKRINQWLTTFKTEQLNRNLGFLTTTGNDFQHKNMVFIYYDTQSRADKNHQMHISIQSSNLIEVCIYLSVRHCIEATWLNDRDQFLYPKDSWKNDVEFHNDCLIFTLFHGQNRISTKEGTNHWIPFTEEEVNAQEPFKSRFMSDFIDGKIKIENEQKTDEIPFEQAPSEQQYYPKRYFSPEAQDVFNAGRELWRYYHSQKDDDINVNASLYDIREHFQGRNEKTQRMNNTSTDEKYNELIGILREKLKILANKITEKVYQHEFLKE